MASNDPENLAQKFILFVPFVGLAIFYLTRHVLISFHKV